MKRIEIIALALKKIEQRRIPRQWIEETINSPGQIVDGYSGRKVRQRKYTAQGKQTLLRVVAEEEEDRIVVITAYLTTQVKRYWMEVEL